MSKRIFIFPGQGSQTIGMGKSFYDSFTEAKEVFQEVDDAIEQNLSKIIFEGPAEDLTLTENTQPALMATSIAILRVLEKQSGKGINDFCDYVAGHSLGEYTALCAANALSLRQTAKLLKIRGKAMQEAVPVGKGGMAAIIGLSFEDVNKITEFASSEGYPLEIANDNSDGQIVVSGAMESVEKGEEKAKELGAKRYLKLPVSAPFHSSMMALAADKMADALAQEEVKKPKVPVIANVTASETSNPEEITRLLIEQVTGRVRWRESVMNMSSKYDIYSSTEIGAGKVLSGLVKRIDKEIETTNIETPEQLEEFLK